ncbi:uncharacterized protein [Diadema antillarum]|uniref:uncharacterized protein n=1 Tax=Diadema antillarum TaxID=105358 RepID=UPI003A876444
MARMERAMGIPVETKKPSSLRNPRDPPPPRYINKQAAIDIARKLKLTSIGKVGLRITNKTSIDAEMRSKYTNTEPNREMSRKSIMDRQKGLEMAKNIAESRVGKCIMETNDYEVRRFNRNFKKLLEDEDQKKRQMTQKKREFVNEKQQVQQRQTLTRADGRRSPLVPTTSESERKHLPNIHPAGATQQHLRDMLSSQDRPRTESRGKSPGYMRPLSCNRDKSHDSAVGETERFLNTPYMRACLSNINDEENTNRVLEGIREANEAASQGGSNKSRSASARERSAAADGDGIQRHGESVPLGAPSEHMEVKRPVSQERSLNKQALQKRLQNVKETSESSSTPRQQASPVPPPTTELSINQKALNTGENAPAPVERVTESGDSKEQSKPPSRGKLFVELLKPEPSSRPSGSATAVDHVRVEDRGSATPDRMKRMAYTHTSGKRLSYVDEGRDSPGDVNKKAKKPQTVAAQIALLRTNTNSRKKRRPRRIGHHSRGLHLSDRTELMKDPRFTLLADSLIPDSSGSRDLYKSMGKFSLPDHVNTAFKTNASRKADSKFRQSKSLQNLTRFEELLNTL